MTPFLEVILRIHLSVVAPASACHRRWIPRAGMQRTSKVAVGGHERGIGLLEVLIAIVLLSIGFLAAARMQIEGMRYSQDAYHLSQARFMLLDMTERMRVNREALDGTSYRARSTAAGTSNPGCVTNNIPCSAADIAIADLHAWSRNLHPAAGDTDFTPLLPSSDSIPARGDITFNAADNVYTVSVQWSENLQGVDTVRTLSVRVFP